MFLTFILGLCCIDQGHDWSDDFALYISQSQALLTGTTADLLEQNRFSMDHSYVHVGPYLYPSGFPMLLLPIYATFGLNFWVMKVYCLFFFIGSLPLIYWIFTSVYNDKSRALFLTLLIAFNYHFIRFSDHVLSDLPFLFFSLLSFYLIQKQVFEHTFKAILLGLLLFFTYTIRDVGIALLPCLLIVQWQTYRHKKNSSLFIYTLPYLSFLVLHYIHATYIPKDSKLLSLLAEISIENVLDNCYYYWLLIGNYFLVFRGMPFYIQAVVASIFCSLLFLGFVQKKQDHLSIISYAFPIISIYLLWVSFQGMRFLFPILPFLLFFILEGIHQSISSQKIKQIILLGLIGCSLLQSLYIAVYYWQKDTNEAYSQELQTMYKFIQTELPQKAIIIFHKPRTLRLFSHRNAVQKPIEAATYQLTKKEPKSTSNSTIIFQTNNYLLIKK